MGDEVAAAVRHFLKLPLLARDRLRGLKFLLRLNVIDRLWGDVVSWGVRSIILLRL